MRAQAKRGMGDIQTPDYKIPPARWERSILLQHLAGGILPVCEPRAERGAQKSRKWQDPKIPKENLLNYVDVSIVNYCVDEVGKFMIK